MMKKHINLTLVACMTLLAGNCVAEQGGTSHYISGQQADFSCMSPSQPGWVFANFYLNYNDATFGKELPFGSRDQTLALGVTANSTADVPAIIYAYPFDFLGGTLSSGIYVPYVWLDIKAKGTISNLAINTENTDANYQSGDIFHVDGTVAQHLPLFGGFAGAGATAFYLKQITGDSGSGASLGAFEAESYGVGPTISYVHSIGKSMLVVDASWLPQSHTANTVKGD